MHVASTPDVSPHYLTVQDAARYLGLSTHTVKRLVTSGRLTPFRPVRGRVLLSVEELETLVRESARVPYAER